MHAAKGSASAFNVQDEHIINGLFGTVRNVKNLTTAAISRFERHVPLPERNKKCKLHMEVMALSAAKTSTLPAASIDHQSHLCSG